MPEKYSHAAHTNRVLKASKARCGARAVLSVMCLRAEFKKPEVTITKAYLSSMTGLERKAVQRALRFLRAEGSIVPIAHFEGGHGHAVTYRLDVVGQGVEAPGSDERAGARSAAISRVLAENPRMTFGEAVQLVDAN